MKKFVRLIISTSLVLNSFTPPAFASDQELFYGKWGTEAQCSEALITEKGTKRATPFEIRPDWLGHGDVWCRLSWVFLDSSPDGTFAVTKALCGEDSVSDYQIEFDLSGNELILVWDGQLKNGPLKRCI